MSSSGHMIITNADMLILLTFNSL